MKLQAVLFDFDGVVFNTESHHELCWEKVARERGMPITRSQFLRGFGVKNYRFIDEILGWTHDPQEIEAISQRKEELFAEHIASTIIDPIPGTVDLLQRVHAAGIPCVIGSSSVRKNIDLILQPYPHIARLFAGIVSAENVQQGKPHPEVFEQGARYAGSEPRYTLVIEDAPLGIQAAKRARMKVVGLTTTFSFEVLSRENPDAIFSDLSSASLEALDALFS